MNHASWLDRRQFLGSMGAGLGSVALAWMLNREARAQQTARRTHFEPKAKRVVQIFCPGAVSHLDTFEYKPELIRRHGQPLPGDNVVTFQGANGNLLRSPWRWRQHGQSGKWVTDL